ncbi:MAG: hypothetical protein K2Q15_03965 [Burkholderiales bacterium]|nr:hypothetical protein [Burkholderiales bacterium]
MSLESQIAELVSATTALVTTFNGKKKEIDQAVSAAVAAVPVLRRVWYVDQISGLDSQLGTPSSPFKTIDKALSATPVGGIADVRLMGDYRMEQDISVEARLLRITKSSESAVRLFTKYFKAVFSTGEVTGLSGFNLSLNASCELIDIGIVFPSAQGVMPDPVTNAYVLSLVRTPYTGGQAMISLRCDRVSVSAPSDFVGTLIGGLNNSAVVLHIIRSTFPVEFSGHYIDQISTGVDPLTRPNLITNINKL